ncbi:MAG: hypothetical protein ACRENM_08205 [Candidatus Dormibacteraceae bacterium]
MAVATILVVEIVSTTAALSFNKTAPYALAGVLIIWMAVYGKRAQRRGERASRAGQGAVAAQEAGSTVPS